MLQQRTLPPDPSSAMVARTFARDVLSTWSESEAADTVTLLVSELVTNAVLHAGSKVEVAVRHRGDWLRVEVADESPILPGQREFTSDATTGRGLGLIEAMADAWGVEPRADEGKIVWFEVPAAHPDEQSQDEPAGDQEVYVPEDEVVIRLLNAPVQLFPATQQHTEALLREYTLMALQMERGQDPPRLVLDMLAVGEQLRAARDAGRVSTDLVVAAPQSARDVVADASVALDVADRMAADGQLLNPPAVPEVRWCREWFLGEVVAQLSGDEPTPWTMAAIRTDSRRPVRVDHRTVLNKLHQPIVVADDQNSIVYANQATEALLGWPAGGLVGQRLTAIIPERLHEAHLAGYTRYQVTRQPRLIGRPVRVPARCQDGSEVDIELVLDALAADGGRQVFVALLKPVDDEQVGGTDDSRHWLRLVDAVLRTVGRQESPSHEALLAAVTEHTGWPVALWWSVEGDHLAYDAAWASSSEFYEAFFSASKARRLIAGEGVPGRVWATATPVWVGDVVRDANFPRMAAALQHGLRTACAFPVLRGEDIIGVVEMFTDDVHIAGDDMLAALGTLGRVLGVAGC